MNIDFNTMKISSETIHPQMNDPAITGMVDIVSRLREEYKSNGYTHKRSLDKYKEEMSRLITKRFGFNIKILYIDESEYSPAYTYTIMLKPIGGISSWCYEGLKEFEKELAEYDDAAIDRITKSIEDRMTVTPNDKLYLNMHKGLVAYKDYKRMMEIDIDLKKAYIHNFPKELTGYVCINLKSLIKDLRLTDKELVAVIWHEVGHNFTSIECTYKNVYNTNILLETIRDEAIKRNRSKEETIKIAYKRITGKDPTKVSVLEIAELLMEEQAAGYYTSFSDLSVTDNELYADNFAVRFGLGGELASGIAKLGNDAAFVASARLSYMLGGAIGGIIYGMIMGGIVGVAAAGFFIIFGIISGSMIGINWRQPIHDQNYDRVRRMKIDVIRQIKNHSLDIETKKDILIILDNIENICKTVKLPSESLNSVLDRMFNATSRLAFNQKRAEKLYESLLDNELYIGSARVETTIKG